MSTCSGEPETGSVLSSASASRKTDSPFISFTLIIDDKPCTSTTHLENSITSELKWRGIKVGGRLAIEPGCEKTVYEERVKEFLEIVSTFEQEAPPCVTVMLVRVDPVNAENFKGVLRELNERASVAKFAVSLIFTVGVLVINDEIKTEDLDFSNNGIWLAKYLARELVVQYTRHLGINNGPRPLQMKTPPIAIFVRETPVAGQKPLSTSLAEALSMEPISFVHHRVGYLISQPDTIAHLGEIAAENGFSRDDVTNGCKIYLKSAFSYELESSAADVVIIDTLNDIYVDVEGMMDIAKEKAYSTFVMEDATEDTIHRIVETMVWMIKRRCHYTDGPFADYFYTQISLHKEMETLRMFFDESLDCSSSSDAGLGQEQEQEDTPSSEAHVDEDSVGKPASNAKESETVSASADADEGPANTTDRGHGDSILGKCAPQVSDISNNAPQASSIKTE